MLFETFTINETVSETGKRFSKVKEAFLKRFAKKEKPQNVIREATNAVLEKEDLV